MVLAHAVAAFGGQVATFPWQWQGNAVEVVYETLGEGTPVLLLPAFSTVSTRAELRDLARGLASCFRVMALDWPGFGDSSRLPLDYAPTLYCQLLEDFVRTVCAPPLALVATGHSAGYGIALADRGLWSQLVLVAPTWRGPLAVMGLPQGVRQAVRHLVQTPFIGQALYSLNTHPEFLRLMYRRHVFVDAGRLSDAYLQQRHAITRSPHARYGPAAFVTGHLDPLPPAAILAGIEAFPGSVLVAIADHAPTGSRQGMEAIAALPGVQSLRLPGSLGLAEEFGAALAPALATFLQA